MAKNNTECEFYPCGLVQLRQINKLTDPLPADGECGIKPSNCFRVQSQNQETIETIIPQTDFEMNIVFPERFKEADGRKRRLP